MTLPEQVETERLQLRWPTEADAEAIFSRCASDPAVTRYLSWHPHQTIDDTREYLRSRIDDREQGKVFNWLIFLRSTGQLIGSIGCGVNGHAVQFGYYLAQDAWGRGYMTEAARAMVQVWLAEPTIWRVTAYCDLENAASARVLEKAGLLREGMLRKYFRSPNLDDELRDVYLYAQVKDG
jgi:RimJ/RimL family protein N-acetyltransferase